MRSPLKRLLTKLGKCTSQLKRVVCTQDTSHFISCMARLHIFSGLGSIRNCKSTNILTFPIFLYPYFSPYTDSTKAHTKTHQSSSTLSQTSTIKRGCELRMQTPQKIVAYYTLKIGLAKPTRRIYVISQCMCLVLSIFW